MIRWFIASFVLGICAIIGIIARQDISAFVAAMLLAITFAYEYGEPYGDSRTDDDDDWGY